MKKSTPLSIAAALLAFTALASAQGTGFTYQGRLNDGTNPANGSYDLRFTIYDSTNSPGTIIAGPLTNAATAVNNGLFTVTLDFGVGVFTGAGRWLEIGVRTGSDAFTPLTPRQAITATPYAITASNLSGTLPATQLTGTLPDGRLSGNVSLLGASVDSAEIADGTIVNADISGSAAIADTKLATISTAGKVADSALSSTVSLLGQTIEGAEITDGTITSADIADGTIVNTDIAPSAAIVDTKLATISTAGKVADSALSGSVSLLGQSIESSEITDGTVSSADIADGTIVNADLSAGAAIADSKLATIATAGKVADTALPANIARLNGTNVFSGTNTFAAVVIATNANNIIGGSFTGTVAATQLTGTLPDGRLSGNVSLLGASVDSAEITDGTIANADISGSAAIADSKLATISTAGKVANSALSSSVSLLGGSIDSAEITDGTIAAADVNAGSFDTTFWRNGGNAGTTPGTHFLGTTDNLPLEFKVNGQRGLRLEPNATSPNVIGGFSGNLAGTNVAGATIAGGGQQNQPNRVSASHATVGGGSGNTASSTAATVGGGAINTASGFAATVGGGEGNSASGNYATIPGGRQNTATHDALAAGYRAKANHQGAFVWADFTGADFASTANNQFSVRASGGARFVTGGAGLTVDGANVSLLGATIDSAEITDGTIAAADVNAANFNTTFWRNGGNAGTTPGTHFLGTTDNQPLEFKVNGQRGLRLEYATDGFLTGVNVIGGYSGNSVGSAIGATVFGGGATTFGSIPNQATASSATVGGGLGNIASGGASTVGGGENNRATGSYATIPGGSQNTATNHAFAAGHRAKANHQGAFVWADSTGADFASTANNQFNVRASGGARFVTGGAGLTVDGKVGVGTVSPDGMLGVSGGDIGADEGGQNSGTTSFGLRFGGSGSTEFIGSKRTVGENQFGLDFYTANSTRVSIRNNGNVGIGTASPATALHVKGTGDTEISVESSSAGGHRWTLQSSHGNPAFGHAAFQIIDRTLGASRMIIWTNGDVGIGFGFTAPASKLHVNGTVTATAFNPPSDRNLKENFTEVSPRAVLDKVAALPISRWNFKGDAATPHVGPMAQDFHAAFGLGTDDKHIATVDADGVALAAIQGLNQKVEERETAWRAELKRRDAQNAKLQEQNQSLEQRVSALEKLIGRLSVAKGDAR